MSDDKIDIYELGATVGNELMEAAEEVAKESLKQVAHILSEALNTIREFDAEAIGEDILTELERIKETGMPIAVEFMETIQGHLSSILNQLDNDTVQELQKNIGRVASLGIKGFIDLWDELQKLIAIAIEEGRELVHQSLPVLNAAVGKISDIYNSDAVQDIIGDGFEEIEEAFTHSRDAVQGAFNALVGISAGGCVTICPLLRFEIFRDFWQIISLFFTNLYQDIVDAPFVQGAKDVLGGIGNFIAVDIPAALQSDKAVQIGVIILLAISAFVYIAYVWFICSAQHIHSRENEIREGHETKKWAEVAAENSKKVKMSTYLLTAMLTLYLPLTRTAVEVILTKPDSFIVQHFADVDLDTMNVISEEPILLFLRVSGYIILATFSLPLPLILARIISKNVPTGSLENPDIAYDVDGEEVQFDDDLYNRLVTQDPNQLKCPYRSLYEGFERKWAHYKIYQLVLKALLAVVMVVFTADELRQSIIALVIFSVFAGLSFYATPFIDPSNDLMDSSGRTASLVVGVGAIVNALSTSYMVNQAMGILICIINTINTIIMGLVFLYGLEKSRLILKNLRGRFDFSDTCLNVKGPAEKIITGWDIKREYKHRIWHTFWENCLVNKCGDEVALRLMELKESTAQSGIENIKQHWDGASNPEISELRMSCRRELEGVDVYWNDKTGTRDGILDSKSAFGKMYIVPYPFHCIIVYDDSMDESFIRHDKFQEFMELNMSPEIQRKRLVRHKLRALSRWAGEIYFPFTRRETRTVRDGIKKVTSVDKDGNTKERNEVNYSTVSFMCSYKNGVIKVGANTNKVMSAGFDVTMTYNDGTGGARLPNTGKMQYFENEQAIMGPNHIDLSYDMEESSKLKEIFQNKQDILTTYLQMIQQEHRIYRNKLISSFEESDSILGNGFWYYVYNRPSLPRDHLEKYLKEDERNPMLRSLVADSNSAALNFVYKRMNYVRLHPSMALWYIFWDDFYNQNKDMKVLQSLDDDFNPHNGHSICYRLMKRGDLETWLGERGLVGAKPSIVSFLRCTPYLFHEGIFDVLYQLLHPELIPSFPASPALFKE